ncbi:MAG TPA: uracil-DNA glycosylase family protein [Phycisphaerales bacterium]|nr:uracil-DNA glycosylase family protein [Phycisphaerales bacterium]
MARTENDRAARQLVETSKLFGVDFVPVKMNRARASAAASEEGASAAVEQPVAEAAPSRPPTVAPRSQGRLSREEKIARLAELRKRHDAECPHCTRSTTHKNIAFSDGDPAAELMFIGEAPGEEEDKQGIPFVGRAGQLLNDMIKAMGLSRDENAVTKGVYIANVLKCRPPNNATPTPDEASKCGPYLQEQVAIVQPRVIVTLGNPATHYILNTTKGITSLRGTWQSYNGAGGIPVMPTYHPAFLLRQYTPENRKKVWSDLQQVMERLKTPGAQ